MVKALLFDVLGTADWRTGVARQAGALFAERATDEAMMVVAFNTDLEAARAADPSTAFVRRPCEFGPGQACNPEPSSHLDVVATDFIDLAGRLEG